MTPAIGIDLGTTNTVVALVRDGQASAIADAAARTLIPSVVSFHPNGTVLVGSEARARRAIDAENTIYSVKRLIGRSWNSEEVRLARSRFPFQMRDGPGNAALVVARGETYTLPEISAFVLRKAKSVAEAHLGTSVQRAVITVPANFNDLQRAATKVAGRVAGLEVLRILNEPTAAALAYGFGRATAERLAVYDFGGGTFDVTLLALSDNVFEVLATAGNTFLGGDDIDVAIADRMASEFLAHHRVDLRADPQAFERLRAAAEEVKHRLSFEAEASIRVEDLAFGPAGRGLHLEFGMTRKEFERLATPIVDRTFDVCREALGVARGAVNDFEQVLLVGGSTRIPLVQARVAEFFGRAVSATVNPDEVVALGAAIQANALTGAHKPRPVPPPPSAAKRAARAPLPHTVAFTISDEEIEEIVGAPVPPEWSGNAGLEATYADDEVTHRGAGAQLLQEEPTRSGRAPASTLALAGMTQDLHAPAVSPETHGTDAWELPRPSVPPPATLAPVLRSSVPPLLIDVTPLTLSVETVSGFCDAVIPRNTPVPCEQTREFVTASDGQTLVRIRVAQGESRTFTDNTLLGEVELSALPALPRGSLRIAVTFALDTNGMLNVRAAESATGQATAVQLKLAGIPEQSDLARLAERHAAHQTF